MGRQAVAGAQPAVVEVEGEGVDDREIARTGDAVEIRLPNCHGDKI
jgi:hypothetical protein